MSLPVVDWSALPFPALWAIAGNLVAAADLVSLRSVCSAWRAALPDIPPKIPRFLVTHKGVESNDGLAVGFGNLPNNQILPLDRAVSAVGKHCCGSAFGLVALLDPVTFEIILLDPFSGAELLLPPINQDPWNFGQRISKIGDDLLFSSDDGSVVCAVPFENERHWLARSIALSSNPFRSPNNVCTVMLVGQAVFICRLGDNTWTSVRPAFSNTNLLFYNGRFYACEGYFLYKLEIEATPLKFSHVDLELPNSEFMLNEDGSIYSCSFLVECVGDLLLILKSDRYEFAAYRVDLVDKRFVRLNGLGNHTLFLGVSQPIIVPAGSFRGYKANSIYYLHKSVDEQLKIVLYDFEDGSSTDIPTNVGDFQSIVEPLGWLRPDV